MENNNVWDLVLSKVDIVSIIGEYVSLIKQGKNYKACCPFHGEKTPSFVVSPEKGIFKCFGCGKSGNSIKFIELYENISSRQALINLAKKASVNIDNYLESYKENDFTDEQKLILEINKNASDFFQYHILISKRPDLLEYLNKRKLTKELIKEFKLGFADASVFIKDYLKTKNFDNFSLSNSSLLNYSGDGNFFNDRLMFPIEDENGNIVAFSGRDITDKNNPKYLNSSETSAFHKSEVMFNYYHAKNEIIKQNEVYLVEGQFDCIALHKANIKNVIAIMGTSLSQKHLELLKNTRINLFFDNDAAGIQATKKNLKMILLFKEKYNLEVEFVLNNLNKDADELFNIDQGKTLISLCKNKKDLVDYLIENFTLIYNQNNIGDIEKFNKYTELFEYMYYLKEQLQLNIRDTLVNKLKIFDKETFDSYKNDYLKPNFPSDQNFVKSINKNKHYKEKNEHSPNYENQESFDWDSFAPYEEISHNFLDVESLEINKKDFNTRKFYTLKKRNSSIIPFGNEIVLIRILKTILSEPLYLEKFNLQEVDFINMEIDLKYKELISYVVKKVKENKTLDFENLNELIYHDEELKLKRPATYNSILKKSEEIIIFNQSESNADLTSNYSSEEFLNSVNNLKEIKKDNSKFIIQKEKNEE